MLSLSSVIFRCSPPAASPRLSFPFPLPFLHFLTPFTKSLLNAAIIYDEPTCMEISRYLEPPDGAVIPEKPLVFLTSGERHDLGLYDSDADWIPKFPIEHPPRQIRAFSDPVAPAEIS